MSDRSLANTPDPMPLRCKGESTKLNHVAPSLQSRSAVRSTTISLIHYFGSLFLIKNSLFGCVRNFAASI